MQCMYSSGQPLRVGMVSVSSASRVEGRVAAVKLPLDAIAPGRAQELTSDSAEIEYFFPHRALRESGWNGRCVRLAHASRQ